jgi:7-cyano-7-deazaguanine tRNA-ribosyltransferase
MERYRFDVLVDMIMTAKMNLPIDKPLHLFGAGHPLMFALAIALGCDLFDSAAYALYAKEDRYMTETGTARLNRLEYFPCTCPKCTSTTPKQVMEITKQERTVFLSEHNLYVCGVELKRIKQAIKDGRLWEHLEMQAHAHPSLLQAAKKLIKYQDYIEKHSPITKNSGLFYFDSIGLARPEIVHYRKEFKENYTKPKTTRTLILVPQTRTKPFHKAEEYKTISRLLNHNFKQHLAKIHVCFYAAPFGIVPIELDEVYPLSQHEIAMPLDKETEEYVANQVEDYINRTNYETIILLDDPENWDKTILNACKKTCRQNKPKLTTLNVNKVNSKKFIEAVYSAIGI